MRILHVIPGISRDTGGPSRSSQGLVAALNKAGVDAYLCPLNNYEPWLSDVKFFKYDPNTFAMQIATFDLVHLHGIWDRRLHTIARICRERSIPYIIAPRGMLEPWSLRQKCLKKRIARFLYQDHDLKSSAALHATAESEAAQFRKLGLRNSIIISPNGVNVPDEKKVGGEIKSTKDDSSSDINLQPQPKRALFVSRMHPKKGVLELVESWARVFSREEHEDWQCELVYTLNGDTEREYEAKVKQRVHELDLNHAFIFTGALSDDIKWEAYRRSNLFVLPTYSENFGIVVAEALYAGVPVITTKGTPWQELETHHCGWWIDLPEKKVGGESRWTVDWPSLDEALKEATTIHCSHSSFVHLRAMGENGHKLILEKYSWPAIAKTIINGYKEVLKNVR